MARYNGRIPSLSVMVGMIKGYIDGYHGLICMYNNGYNRGEDTADM